MNKLIMLVLILLLLSGCETQTQIKKKEIDKDIDIISSSLGKTYKPVGGKLKCVLLSRPRLLYEIDAWAHRNLAVIDPLDSMNWIDKTERSLMRAIRLIENRGIFDDVSITQAYDPTKESFGDADFILFTPFNTSSLSIEWWMKSKKYPQGRQLNVSSRNYLNWLNSIERCAREML